MTEDTSDLSTPSIEHIPAELPLLPVRDIVIFPYMVLPLFVGRDLSIKAIEAALSSDRLIFFSPLRKIKKPTNLNQMIFIG